MLKDKNILSYKKIYFGAMTDDIHLEEHETEITDLGYFVEIEMLDSNLSIQEANAKLNEVVTELGLDISKRNLDGLLYEKLYANSK